MGSFQGNILNKDANTIHHICLFFSYLFTCNRDCSLEDMILMDAQQFTKTKKKTKKTNA